MQGPGEILGVPVPKKFWKPWRITQKKNSKEISLTKYDFRKIGEAMGPFTLLRRENWFRNTFKS